MQYENIYFFNFWECCVLKGHKQVQKIQIWEWKIGVKTQFTKNPFLTILSNLDMNFIFEYVNLMFLKDFETFISQKNSRQKKL